MAVKRKNNEGTKRKKHRYYTCLVTRKNNYADMNNCGCDIEGLTIEDCGYVQLGKIKKEKLISGIFFFGKLLIVFFVIGIFILLG